MKKILVVIFIAFSITGNVYSQSPGENEIAQKVQAAMKKLEPLAGEWEGSATITRGPNKTEIKQQEKVSFKVKEHALLIEGTGLDSDGNVVFEAIGLIVYSPFTESYSIRAVRDNGLFIDTEVIVSDNQLQWTIPAANGGKARQTITFDDSSWEEVGEYSQDGEHWMRYLSMSLTKKE